MVAGYTLPDIVREAQGSLLLRGTRDADGARVIVKMLRGEHPTTAQIARLRHEHALLATLDLPEVVCPLALVPHGRSVALVLEDLGDVSLESKFRHERPTLLQFLDLSIRMAGAVGAVHRRAVIHKDIKPHHFLLERRPDQAHRLRDRHPAVQRDRGGDQRERAVRDPGLHVAGADRADEPQPRSAYRSVFAGGQLLSAAHRAASVRGERSARARARPHRPRGPVRRRGGAPTSPVSSRTSSAS